MEDLHRTEPFNAQRMIEAFAASQQQNKERSQPLWDILNRIAKRISYRPPQAGIVYVLDLHSGNSYDATALTSFFGNAENGVNSEFVHVYAIEPNPHLHRQATELNWRIICSDRVATQPPSNLHLLNDDPARLPEIQLPGQFNAVIMRRVQSANEDAPWQQTIHDAINLITPEGIAIFTTLDDADEDRSLQHFFENPAYDVLMHDKITGMQLASVRQSVPLEILTVVRKAADYKTPKRPALPNGYIPTSFSEEIK